MMYSGSEAVVTRCEDTVDLSIVTPLDMKLGNISQLSREIKYGSPFYRGYPEE